MKGTIYRIVSLSHPEIQYVGSTGDTLNKRWLRHKIQFKAWKDDPTKIKLSIFPYFSEYGIDDFRIILIKQYEVVDKHHLSSYEQLYMNRIKCVNSNKAWHVNANNCKWMMTQYNIQYNKKNKEIINEKAKLNYRNNQERLVEKSKIYRENNPEAITKSSAMYRDNNKQKIHDKYNEKVVCECGKTYTHGHISRHIKSKYHIEQIVIRSIAL